MEKVISDKCFSAERALYHSEGLTLINCRFEGIEDGESALKESKDIIAKNCYMDLRYPYWHVRNLELDECEFTAGSRAAMWYDENVRVSRSKLNGIKAFRECRGVSIKNSEVVSDEFMWRSRDIAVRGSDIAGKYAFFESSDITLKDVKFSGKYSFQYVKNLVIEDSELDTKDAFWHAENVTVRNSVVKGEYLGWYSDGLTLINCRIIGTQPLCYCKNLKFVDCTTENADLAFEYSDVEADIKGGIISVKNPRSGRIVSDGIGEAILTPDSVYPPNAEIVIRGK